MTISPLTRLLCEAVLTDNTADARFLADRLLSAPDEPEPVMLWTPCGYVPAPDNDNRRSRSAS